MSSNRRLAKVLNREVLRLALPSILANITIPLVGMVDTAIAGRMGSAAPLAAIALGTTMFDWFYWNMSFLRTGTSGLCAQAYGRGKPKDAAGVFVMAETIALLLAFCLLLIAKPYSRLFFQITPVADNVRSLALDYFFVRVWAAPAAFTVFVLKGWILGMQNSVGTMLIDLVVNIGNIVCSLFFVLFLHMGVKGIALGTLVAQYAGVLCGVIILLSRYRHVFAGFDWSNWLHLEDIRRFFSLNTNLFLRSFCMLLIYGGFNMLAAQWGDSALAVSSVMMKLLLLYSYFIDGFAYAGEAVVGRKFGAGNVRALRISVRILFVWCLFIGLLSTAVYGVAGKSLLKIMTNVEEVLAACQPYLIWLYVMPFISCIAFTWDGIFIGACASTALRNNMLLAMAGFFLSYLLLSDALGLQSLWIGYALHLVIRSVSLTLFSRRDIYGAAESKSKSKSKSQ